MTCFTSVGHAQSLSTSASVRLTFLSLSLSLLLKAKHIEDCLEKSRMIMRHSESQTFAYIQPLKIDKAKTSIHTKRSWPTSGQDQSCCSHSLLGQAREALKMYDEYSFFMFEVWKASLFLSLSSHLSDLNATLFEGGESLS